MTARRWLPVTALLLSSVGFGQSSARMHVPIGHCCARQRCRQCVSRYQTRVYSAITSTISHELNLSQRYSQPFCVFRYAIYCRGARKGVIFSRCCHSHAGGNPVVRLTTPDQQLAPRLCGEDEKRACPVFVPGYAYPHCPQHGLLKTSNESVLLSAPVRSALVSVV